LAEPAPGTLIAFEIEPAPPDPRSAGAQPPQVLLSDWESLRKLVERAKDSGRGTAPSWSEPLAVHPARDLPAKIAHYLLALTRQSLEGWLGDNLRGDAEPAGGSELVQRFRDEFAQLGKSLADAPPGEWRGVPLPLFAEGELARARMFMRRGRKGSDDQQGPGDSRLLIDLELTRLGPVQLDGLLHRRRFDLVVRTRIALPEAIRRDVHGVFAESCVIAGLSGTVGFQTGVKPLPASTGPARKPATQLTV
jgi:hypothetical protein